MILFRVGSTLSSQYFIALHLPSNVGEGRTQAQEFWLLRMKKAIKEVSNQRKQSSAKKQNKEKQLNQTAKKKQTPEKSKRQNKEKKLQEAKKLVKRGPKEELCRRQPHVRLDRLIDLA